MPLHYMSNEDILICELYEYMNYQFTSTWLIFVYCFTQQSFFNFLADILVFSVKILFIAYKMLVNSVT